MPVRRLATIVVAVLVSLTSVGCDPVETSGKHPSGKTTTAVTTSRATLKITASDSVCWAGQVGRGNKKGCGSSTLQVKDSNGTYTIFLHKTKGNGKLTVVFAINGTRVDSGSITGTSGVVSISYAESRNGS
jgi:hypothetical protein